MHLSQNLGRSWGSMPYRRKRSYRSYCTPSSVPFTINICNSSHYLVFVTRHKRRATWAGAPAGVSGIISSDRLVFHFLTSYLPSRINMACSDVLKSSCPLISSTRFTVMTQDNVQFSGAVSVRSGRSRPACFTGRRVNPYPKIPSHVPWKRSGMNE